MNPPPALNPCIVPPDGGQTLHAFGNKVIVHLGGAETGGLFTLATVHVPPKAGPPLHYHLNDDECFIPLAGRVEFFQNEVWTEAPVGSVVFLPRGSRHTFRNPGDEPAKMLVQNTPSGFEKFFAECAEVFAKPGPPDMARLVAISAEYGIHYPNLPAGGAAGEGAEKSRPM